MKGSINLSSYDASNYGESYESMWSILRCQRYQAVVLLMKCHSSFVLHKGNDRATKSFSVNTVSSVIAIGVNFITKRVAFTEPR